LELLQDESYDDDHLLLREATSNASPFPVAKGLERVLGKFLEPAIQPPLGSKNVGVVSPERRRRVSTACKMKIGGCNKI
jgi:hypothetical protein